MAEKNCCLCGMLLTDEEIKNTSLIKKCSECENYFHITKENCIQLSEDKREPLLKLVNNSGKCPSCNKCCCLCGGGKTGEKGNNRPVVNCNTCSNFFHRELKDCTKLVNQKELHTLVNKSGNCPACKYCCCLCEKRITQSQNEDYSVVQCRCLKFIHLKSVDCSKLRDKSSLGILVNKSLKCPSCNKCAECKKSFTLQDENIRHCDSCEALFYHNEEDCSHNCKIKDENTLRCLQWNVQKMNDFDKIKLTRWKTLSYLLRHKDIDIVFLQDFKEDFKKTAMKEEKEQKKTNIFENYDIFPIRDNHQYRVHFLIRKNGLKLVEDDKKELFFHSKVKGNEILRIKIKKNDREIFLTNFYCPPPKKKETDSFNTEHWPKKEFGIFAGDFNAHSTLWDEDCTSSNYATNRGNELVKWMNKNHCSSVNDEAEKTFRSDYIKSQLTAPDITFFKNILSADIDFHQDSLNWRVIPMRDDHYAIKFDIVYIKHVRKIVETRMSVIGLKLLETVTDGSCQYDSVAKSCGKLTEELKRYLPGKNINSVLYNEPHQILRKLVIDYFKKNILKGVNITKHNLETHFSKFGNELTLRAMAEILQQDIYVITSDIDSDIHIFPDGSKPKNVDANTILIARISKLHYFGVLKEDEDKYNLFLQSINSREYSTSFREEDKEDAPENGNQREEGSRGFNSTPKSLDLHNNCEEKQTGNQQNDPESVRCPANEKERTDTPKSAEPYDCAIASIKNSKNRCWGIAALTALAHLNAVPQIQLHTIHQKIEQDKTYLATLKALTELSNSKSSSEASVYSAIDAFASLQGWEIGNTQDSSEFAFFVIEALIWAFDWKTPRISVRCTQHANHQVSSGDLPPIIVCKDMEEGTEVEKYMISYTSLVFDDCCSVNWDGPPEILVLQLSNGIRPSDLLLPTVFGVEYALSSLIIHKGDGSSKYGGHYFCGIFQETGKYYHIHDSEDNNRAGDLKETQYYVHVAIFQKKLTTENLACQSEPSHDNNNKKEQMNLKMTPKLTDTTYQSAENIDTEKKEDKESSLNVKEDNGGKYYCYESSNGKTTEQNEEKITQMISELDLDPQIEEKKVTGNT